MENTELTHHGILGMKWGVRRYQNKDGSLTEAGRKRYDDKDDSYYEKLYDNDQNLTKSGHEDQKFRRQKLSLKEAEKELEKIYEDKKAEFRLDREISKYCCNAFSGEYEDEYTGRTPKIKQILSDGDKVLAKCKNWKDYSETFDKITDKLRSAVLEELGYPDTKETRSLISVSVREAGWSDKITLNDVLKDDDELSHHGILGMKWGRRRYQNKDGSLTPEGRKRYGDGDGDSNESYEDRKAKAIKSGSAKDVMRFQGDLTQQEMQFALSRIKWEKEMKSIEASETVTGKDRVDKFFDGVKTATGYAGKAIQAYNTVANIINAFSDRDVDLPKISTNLSNDNKELRKQQEKARKEANKLADEYDQVKEKKQKKEEKKAQKEVDELKKEAEKKAKTEEETEKVNAEKVTVSDSPNKNNKTETKKRTRRIRYRI